MCFWNYLAFSMIQQMLAIWSLVPLPLLKPAWTSGSSWPGLENFKHYFTSVWDECNCEVVWAFFGIAFLWDWNEWPFPVLWPLLSFPNLLAYWVQHFHSIIFQDLKELNWNSITSTRWQILWFFFFFSCVASGEWLNLSGLQNSYLYALIIAPYLTE